MPSTPRLNLTKAQWRGLLGRLLKAEPHPTITPEAADTMLKYEPPVTRNLTTLQEKVPIEGVNAPVEKLSPELYRLQPRRMAYDEALSQYMEAPGRYAPPSGYGGGAVPADVISKVGIGSPEELAQGLAYERVNMKPFQLPSDIAKTTREMRRMELSDTVDQGMASRGLTPEDISIAPQQFLRQQGESIQPPPIADVVQKAAIAEMLWQEAGAVDKRSVLNRTWKELLDGQKQGVKDVYRQPKDYFLYCFRQFDKNPSEMMKKRPKEARIIEKMYEQMDSIMGGD